jgi:hypothetical protein
VPLARDEVGDPAPAAARRYVSISRYAIIDWRELRFEGVIV